jgi:peptidoglycan/xylan/chitin deacetylase (PgdA/CDA1 family)
VQDFNSCNLAYSIFDFFPGVTSRIRIGEKVLFLTFDDGPVPEVTPDVLNLLSAFQAKATFFCIGDNVIKHGEIFLRILEEGHSTGNHTFHHLNGWKNSKAAYIEDTVLCDKAMQHLNHNGKKLFRPPYGKIGLIQYLALKKDYKIVMWDTLARDWEKDRNAESCFERVKRKAAPGSIIVFHDSIKARERMLPALEMTLKHYTSLGFRFESLEKFA